VTLIYSTQPTPTPTGVQDEISNNKRTNLSQSVTTSKALVPERAVRLMLEEKGGSVTRFTENAPRKALLHRIPTNAAFSKATYSRNKIRIELLKWHVALLI